MLTTDPIAVPSRSLHPDRRDRTGTPSMPTSTPPSTTSNGSSPNASTTPRLTTKGLAYDYDPSTRRHPVAVAVRHLLPVSIASRRSRTRRRRWDYELAISNALRARRDAQVASSSPPTTRSANSVGGRRGRVEVGIDGVPVDRGDQGKRSDGRRWVSGQHGRFLS